MEKKSKKQVRSFPGYCVGLRSLIVVAVKCCIGMSWGSIFVKPDLGA